ncbi:MAG: 30S ribosome-binding factor RbfA [Bacteroidia bacterium]
MDSTRQLKVSRLVQKELGEIFQLECRSVVGNVLTSVTMVRISPDLSSAKVYLSIFGTKTRETLMEKITESTKEIRKALGMRIGKQVRIIPHLTFFLDDSFDYAEKIDLLLKKK